MPASPRRRAFGQHFLHDSKIIDLIIRTTFEAVENFSAKALLEIGPGKGALTEPLLAASEGIPALERLIIVEKDRSLATEWANRAQGDSRLRVIENDFLKVTHEEYLEKFPLIVVSNLPYSAGTAILQELARSPLEIPAMILMFQAEVAARLRAHPGEKAWGSLSLWIQNHWDVRKILSAPPSAFSPPPDVHSEVVFLQARNVARVPCPPCPHPERNTEWILSWEKNWEKLIRIPFLHRRKMLRSGLPKDSVWKETLEEAGIDGTKRAEELEWDEWRLWLTAAHSRIFLEK